MDIKSLRGYDLDLPAIIDLFTKEKVIQTIGPEEIIQTIGPEKVIQTIGPEKFIQTMFPELPPEKAKELIERLAKQLQDE